jgi:peptidyl-prolyl cis-trans isomerase C
MSATAPVRTLISKPPRQRISVNGVAIGSQDILREARNHANERPAEAWHAAATALVVKELLVQEARRLGISGAPASDGEGRTETAEEAAIRTLVERQVTVPEATVEESRRYYENHRARFRSATLTEAAHILLAAAPEDLEARQAAAASAQSLCDRLAADPDAFEALARQHSQCPSAGQGGSLGQLLPGSTVPEFETGMARLAPGEISRQPVETRFGFHVVRVERRIEGRDLPFELVHDRIAAYLHDAAAHRAQAQYIARLVSSADIKGLDMAGAADHRVH